MEPQLDVVGSVHHPGYRHPLVYVPDDRLDRPIGLGSRCRLVLISEGHGIARLCGASYPVPSPVIYCLNAGESFLLLEGSGIRASSILFHPALINQRFGLNGPDTELRASDAQDAWCLAPIFERQDGAAGCCLPLDPAMAAHAAALMAEIGAVLSEQADAHWPCRSRSCLFELLFAVRRIYQRASFDAPPVHTGDEVIRPVIRYLHTRYRDRITLDDLTRRFHTNRTTLNALFRRHTGRSTIAYLHAIRLQMAASMLRNTLLPASEIAERVGIPDDALFIRHFRKFAGCTPAQYRKRRGWMHPQPDSQYGGQQQP